MFVFWVHVLCIICACCVTVFVCCENVGCLLPVGRVYVVRMLCVCFLHVAYIVYEACISFDYCACGVC